MNVQNRDVIIEIICPVKQCSLWIFRASASVLLTNPSFVFLSVYQLSLPAKRLIMDVADARREFAKTFKMIIETNVFGERTLDVWRRHDKGEEIPEDTFQGPTALDSAGMARPSSFRHVLDTLTGLFENIRHLQEPRQGLDTIQVRVLYSGRVRSFRLILYQ